MATIASNTGRTSVGERLITRRISALAVWLASASLVSLNRRAFWIAITAWSANVRSSASSFSVNGSRRLAHDHERADAAVLPQHRHPGSREVADLLAGLARPLVGPSAIAAASAICTMRRSRIAMPVRLVVHRHGQGARHRLHDRAAHAPRHATMPSSPHHDDAQVLGAEQPLAAVEDLVEHRRGVGHRAADHLQHLGRGGLLLERLLGLVEQRAFWIAITAWSAKVRSSATSLSHERAGPIARHPDRADRAAFPQHRRTHGRLDAERLRTRGVRPAVPRRDFRTERRPASQDTVPVALSAPAECGYTGCTLPCRSPW